MIHLKSTKGADVLVLAGIVNFLYSSLYGVNHPQEQQGKKESRISGRSLPFYTQTGAKKLERAMKWAEP